MTLDTDNIITTVSQVYGVTESDILGRSRKQPIAEARQMCMYLCSTFGMNKVETARMFSRTHTDVVYTVRHISDLIKFDKAVARKYIEIIQKL